MKHYWRKNQLIITDKNLIIDAIIGKGFYHINGYHPNDFADVGLAVFTGNQWNEDWEWNKEELKQLSTEELNSIYTGVVPDNIKLKIEKNRADKKAIEQSYSVQHRLFYEWWAKQMDELLFKHLSEEKIDKGTKIKTL